jgi:hypothetical protein
LLELAADRMWLNAGMIDLRIEAPPLATVARGKMSVQMWFKVSLQRSTSKAVQVASSCCVVVLPARLPAYFLSFGFFCVAVGQCVFLFKASSVGCPGNFDTEQSFSSCDEAQLGQSLEGVANHQTVACPVVRPGSSIALT